MFGFRKRKTERPSDDILRKIHGKSVRYVSTRDPSGCERVLGKTGRINVTDTHIAVVCDGTLVFRCRLEGARAAELMSLDGAVISGVTDTGERREIVAHYTYYRNVRP